jgi:hypothetical protein
MGTLANASRPSSANARRNYISVDPVGVSGYIGASGYIAHAPVRRSVLSWWTRVSAPESPI